MRDARPPHELEPFGAENHPNGERAPLLDAAQAAELLNVKPSWVLAEARADRIPHVRLGRYVRFEVDELCAWWQARRRGPRRAPGGRVGHGPARRGGDSA